MSADTKVRYGSQNKYLPAQLRDIDLAVEQILGWDPYSMTITQGSFSTSVGASGNTHGGPNGQDLTPQEETKKEKFLRICGCMHYIRPALPRVWGRHSHGGTDYANGTRAYKQQLAAYHRRENALANRGRDAGYHMLVFPKNIYGGYKGYVRAKTGTGGYEQPTGKSRKLKSYKKGEIAFVVAEVEVAGSRWYITIYGKCILARKFSKIKKP